MTERNHSYEGLEKAIHKSAPGHRNVSEPGSPSPGGGEAGDGILRTGKPVCRYESILLAMSSGNVEYLEDGETVYTIHYSTGATETATRTVLNDGSIAYVCEGASGQSVVTLSADGKILLDGHKVRHTTIRYYDCDESTYSMTADTVPYVGRMEVFSKTPFASKVYSKLLVKDYHLVEFANDELDNLILTTAISIFIFAVAPTVSLNFDFVSNCMTILTGILSSFCSHHPLSDAMATYIWQWTTPTITDPYNQYFMYQLHYLESPPKIAVDPKNYKCENCSEHETIYSVLTQGL